MGDCERCGKASPAASSASYALHDFCYECGTNLCADCMEEGCCGHIPALSGMRDGEPFDREAE